MARPPKAEAPRAKLIMKGQRVALHHLFKSDIKPMLKNTSFKKGAPRIEKVEHAHFFHSINAQMKPQQYSSTVGGHFHEIEWGMVDGVPVIKKVGPAIGYRYVKKPNGQKKKLGSIQWRDENEERDLVDDHTHEFTYLHSEEVHESRVRSVQSIPPSLEEQMQSVGIEDTSL